MDTSGYEMIVIGLGHAPWVMRLVNFFCPIFMPGQQAAAGWSALGQVQQLWGTWVGERTGGPVVAVALGAGQHLCSSM
jgi:hypothetical protein